MGEYKLVLKKAFEEVERRELGEIPADNDIDWTPSPQFEWKMNKLINEQKRRSLKHSHNIGKKIVVVLIAVLAALLCAMSVGASRDAIIEFYQRVFEDRTELDTYTSLKYEGHVPEQIEKKYTLSNLNEDFVVTHYYEDDLQVETQWTDKCNKNDIYIFQQFISSSAFSFDTEGTQMIQKKINGYNVYTYSKNDYSTYIWNEKGYVFNLKVPIHAGGKFAKSVIGKLKIKK